MAELDKVPQKQQIEIAVVKMEEATFNEINELNSRMNSIFMEFGQIHMRRKEIQEETLRMDDALERGEDEFKMINQKLKELVDDLDEKYPQGRINMQDGTIQYQPGAPSRRQVAEMQKQQQTMPDGSPSGMKVVKE
jgi:predicted nuclease with TOPRIM domain